MLDRRARGPLERDFETSRTLGLSSLSDSSYSGFLKEERKTYILIAYSSSIHLILMLNICYCYSAVKPSMVNKELGIFIVPVMPIIMDGFVYILVDNLN